MTKRLLEQYASLKSEIGELEEELCRAREMSDTVSASSCEWPYTLHSVCIKGCSGEEERLRQLLGERKRLLLAKREEIERFLNSLEDSRLRRMIRLRYLSGKTWQQIAFQIGHHDEQYPRKKCERFLKSCAKDEKDEKERVK